MGACASICAKEARDSSAFHEVCHKTTVTISYLTGIKKMNNNLTFGLNFWPLGKGI